MVIVFCFEDVAVMSNAVKQRHGHPGIARDLHPFPEGLVGGNDQADPLIELADQVE